MSSTTAPPTSETVDQRAISLVFDFIRGDIADPEAFAVVPNGATVTPIPDDDPELAASMIEGGLIALRRGTNVYFVHVTHNPDGTLTIKRRAKASAAE